MKKAFLIVLTLLLVMLAGAALADPGDSIVNAIPIDANIDTHDSLTGYDDINYYKFTLPADGYVSVSFSHEYIDESREYWRLWLINGNQNEYIPQKYYGNVMSETTSFKTGLPAGTYYIKITPGTWFISSEFSFRVNYTESNAWETEFNNSPPYADPISVNTEISGTIKDWDDEDYYKFVLPEDGNVSVSFSHEYIDNSSEYWRLQIMNVDQKVYLSQSYDGTTLSEITSHKVGLPAGTYYIKIYRGNSHNASVGYTFSVNFSESNVWETEFNNSIPNADRISINTAYSGAIQYDDDNDYYQFSTDSNGFVTLSFTHDYVNNSSVLWHLQLVNADGNEYLYQEYVGNVSSETTSCRIGLPAGNYYVRVGDNGSRWSGATYTFSVNYKESSAWETEFNNDMDSADSIAVGKKYFGVTRNMDDQDYFIFKMKKSGRVFVIFEHEDLHASETKWNISILDSAQNKYLDRNISGNVTRTEMDYVDLAAGTYYVKVARSTQYYYYSNQYSMVPYSFTVCSNQVTVSGLNYTLSGSEAVFTGMAKRGAKTANIPASIKVYGNTYKVTEIEDGACKGLTKLAKVTIGKNVSVIGKKAFQNCSALQSVSGGAGVVTIEESAFQGCKALLKYDLGSKTRTVGKAAFQNCVKLASVSGGKNLVTIGVSAFRNCAALKEFTFGSKVASIGKDAYNGCKALASLIFKTTKLKESTIGANAFKSTPKKGTAKCPKSKKALYQKILRKRGISKSYKFK